MAARARVPTRLPSARRARRAARGAPARASLQEPSASDAALSPEVADPEAAVFKAAGGAYAGSPAELDTVETVQLIRVVFQIKHPVTFGEGLRLVGGHEALGNWSLPDSLRLQWSAGDVWRSEEVELPVDGVYVYKYVQCGDGGDPKRPISWQQGNNQVLTLMKEDAPLLEVHDNWRGDPASASTCKPDGSERMQTESRLVARVQEADAALRDASLEIKALTEELRRAKLQAKALREEARLGANVRLALKDQLKAEKKRSSILEQQVDAWKQKFTASQLRLRGDTAPAKANGKSSEEAKKK